MKKTSALVFAIAAGHATSSAYANFTSEMSGGNSGLCADVESASQADGANVIQWTCHGGANQRLDFRLVLPTTDTYTAVFAHSGKCPRRVRGEHRERCKHSAMDLQ